MLNLFGKRKSRSEPVSMIIPEPESEREDDGTLVAVITAAVSMILAGEHAPLPIPENLLMPGDFVIRSIRRTSQSGIAWNRAGREEQIFSRL